MRPRREILLELDYKRVLEKICDPMAYVGRVRRMAKMLDNSKRGHLIHAGDPRKRFNSTEMPHRLIAALPEPRDAFWQAIVECVSANPHSVRYILTIAAVFQPRGLAVTVQ